MKWKRKAGLNDGGDFQTRVEEKVNRGCCKEERRFGILQMLFALASHVLFRS
jgi:hypothetical protein